ncbi:MAG: thiamine phosphate synthase [Terriglobales bacterium]
MKLIDGSTTLLLYYVTDRTQFAGDEPSRRRALLGRIAEAALCGVDFIQLRERDLSAGELEALARDAVRTVRENSSRTRLLINSRTDVAIACGADGVHLRSDDVLPGEVRAAWIHSLVAMPMISVSCHSPAEVARAAAEAADLAVFAPVFEKRGLATAGLAALHEACEHPIKVLALGGITLENAHGCVEAGAAGVAGIRLFQENEVAGVVRALRDGE